MDVMLKVAVLACGLVLLAPGCWTLCRTDCESGWTYSNGSCWHVTTLSMPWFEALLNCTKQGAKMAIPRNAYENKFLGNLIPRAVGKGWLGVTRRGQEDFQSVHSLRLLTFAKWDRGQPDSFGGREEGCVALHGNGFWHDYPCSGGFHMAAICRKD